MNNEKLQNALSALESIVERNEDICNSEIKSLLAQDSFYSARQVSEHLTHLRDAERVLKIGVIGRVKAGKSSLINSLLFEGKEVLPKAATPMTAALTSIGYSDKFTAKVRFFNNEDISQIKAQAHLFDAEVERSVSKLKEEHKARQSERPGAPQQNLDETRLREKAIREVSKNATLSAAADLWQRISSSSDVDSSTLGDEKILHGNSPEELNDQLMDYVGSSGRYMPYTRELVLGMPLESLKGIEVLDTPGLNDPVKSREQRTYERLKECSAAFIVSPSGQFMSEQDFDLADRLSAREGTQEIYIVASQADLQLHSSVRADAKGQFPEAIKQLRGSMASQATKALAKCENEVLRRIANEQDSRLFLTSGICQTLLLNPVATNDQTAQHAIGLLKKSYPDYFSDDEITNKSLTLLSGRDALLSAIKSVQAKKEDILAAQEASFISAQWKTFIEIRDAVIQQLNQRKNDVETLDKAEVEEKLQAIKKAASKGISVANNEFQDQVATMSINLTAQLERVMQQAIQYVDEQGEQAEGVEHKTVKVEKDGAWSWVGRKIGLGGYEDQQVSETTLKPLPIRRALDGMARLIRNGLNDCATTNMLQWQRNLISSLSRRMREEMGDELVDIDQLQSVCRNTVMMLMEHPKLDVPELPGELARSRMIKGSKVDEYIEAANDYLRVLEKSGNNFSDEVRSKFKTIADKDIGRSLLEDLVAEMEQLNQMLEYKATTIEKISRMAKDLKEI